MRRLSRREFAAVAVGATQALGCNTPTRAARPPDARLNNESTEEAPRMTSASVSQPNILIIHVDQHRADCLGCYGGPDIRTPHIDALAADERRCPRCGAIMNLERRGPERRGTIRRRRSRATR